MHAQSTSFFDAPLPLMLTAMATEGAPKSYEDVVKLVRLIT